jgi:hypothetical protein
LDEQQQTPQHQRLYERTRDELAANTRSVAETYDRALLTLSSAFLGGSLAFIGQVIDLRAADLKRALYISWLLFAVTIILTLSSFVYGLFQNRTLRHAARRYYMEGDQEAWQVSDKAERAVLRFSVACGLSFGFAILFLIAFISINLVKGAVPMSSKNIQPERVEKSVPPSTFQTPAPSLPTTPPSTAPQSPTPQTPGKQGS